MNSDMDDVKHQVAAANRVLADVGLAVGVTAALGHASMRVPGRADRFVVKGREYAIDGLAAMRPADMVVCDTEGFLVEGPPGVSQCAEVKIHSCIYKTRPDVHAVVHVHPRYTVLMSVLQLPVVPMCIEGVQLVRDPLPVYPHMKIIQSDEEGMEVARLLASGPALLLRGHGAVTAGASLSEVVTDMLALEEQAKMNYLAYCALGPEYPSISDELIDEIGNRPALYELPHFRDVLKGQPPRREGIWNYRVSRVSQDVPSGGS